LGGDMCRSGLLGMYRFKSDSLISNRCSVSLLKDSSFLALTCQSVKISKLFIFNSQKNSCGAFDYIKNMHTELN